MTMFIIYKSPSDYPGKFIVREACSIHEHIRKSNPEEFAINPKEQIIFKIEPEAITDTLEEAREAIPNTHFCRIPRDISDDPVIVETWL